MNIIREITISIEVKHQRTYTCTYFHQCCVYHISQASWNCNLPDNGSVLTETCCRILQNVWHNTNYLISVFSWWLIYNEVHIHGICNTLKYKVTVRKFLDFYSSIHEVSIVMGYNTIHLSNWLPVFTNHIVVSSSRDEMFKKNEEFKMLGTTYPTIWCHIPEEQILQSIRQRMSI